MVNFKYSNNNNKRTMNWGEKTHAKHVIVDEGKFSVSSLHLSIFFSWQIRKAVLLRFSP